MDEKATSAGPQNAASPLSSSDEHTWAMLAHLSVFLNLITGFLGPVAALVIYLTYRDRSKYVAYHALQSAIFQLIWWVGGGLLVAAMWIVSISLAVVLIGLLCLPLACLISPLPLVSIVFGVVGAVQTSQGLDFSYWLVGDWVRGTLEES